MSAFRCHFCRQHVQWMLTKFRDGARHRRMLFDLTPVPLSDVPITDGREVVGWIPGPWKVGMHERTVMAPIDHYGRDKRARVRHAVLLHACVTAQQESA